MPTDNRKTIADPDLALVSAGWERLPEVVRAGIVAMVRASLPAD